MSTIETVYSEVREAFENFLGSDKFNELISLIKSSEIAIGEIDYKTHRFIIEDFSRSGGSGSKDAQEAEAEKRGKYFRISITVDGDPSNTINAHRIVNPNWWVLTEPPEDEIHLVSSCWVYGEKFAGEFQNMGEVVDDILKNLDIEKLYNYEAISP